MVFFVDCDCGGSQTDMRKRWHIFTHVPTGRYDFSDGTFGLSFCDALQVARARLFAYFGTAVASHHLACLFGGHVSATFKVK